MFKRLRIRFIALSMASLLLVLLVILGAVNLMSYRGVVRDADQILDLLAENGGAFPKPEEPAPYLPMHPDGWDDDDFDDEPDDDDDRGEDLMPTREHIRSQELPYESRFFTVTVNEAGDVLSVDTGKIAAVDMDAAVDYAESVLSGGFPPP